MRNTRRHPTPAARPHGVRSSMVERLIVSQEAAGSSPVAHPRRLAERFTAPARLHARAGGAR